MVVYLKTTKMLNFLNNCSILRLFGALLKAVWHITFGDLYWQFSQ